MSFKHSARKTSRGGGKHPPPPCGLGLNPSRRYSTEFQLRLFTLLMTTQYLITDQNIHHIIYGHAFMITLLFDYYQIRYTCSFTDFLNSSKTSVPDDILLIKLRLKTLLKIKFCCFIPALGLLVVVFKTNIVNPASREIALEGIHPTLM